MKLALILPYFGPFKNYFELFLKSVEKNSNIDLILITDNEDDIAYPQNVKLVKMQFEEFKDLVRSKFDFEISLDTPYKLCDYKPAFGYICEEMIRDYDYWGHCDCDLLFGDLSKINELMEQDYDKLFVAGHLTIYKNTTENNRVFMSELPGIGYLYRAALGNPEIYAFDEVCYKVNVNSLFEYANKKIYEKDLAYNSSTAKASLQRISFDSNSRRWIKEKSCNDQIYWENGHVYRVRYRLFRRIVDEYIYVHLQMRQMKYDRNLLNESIIAVCGDEFKKAKAVPANIVQYICNIRFYFDPKVIKKYYYKLKNAINGSEQIKWKRPWEYNPYI